MEILFSLTIMLIVFLVIGGIIIVLIRLLLKTKTPKELYQDSKHKIKEAKISGRNIYENLVRSDENKLLYIDDELFAIANNEVETSSQNEGLWIKSLILAKGDKNKQKIEYIKLRVNQLNRKEKT